MLITAIDETDSDGIILYGIDLTYGNSEETSMVAVHANEFIKRIKPDKQAFFFTFGTAKQFPYQGGYLIVRARNQAEAIQRFRRSYPDINESGLIRTTAALIVSATKLLRKIRYPLDLFQWVFFLTSSY